MTPAELQASALAGGTPPAGLTPELTALWLAKAGQWEASHNIAQDIESPDGSWIHALLHLIEGDTGNAGYWFARAGRPAAGVAAIDAEWTRIAGHLLAIQ